MLGMVVAEGGRPTNKASTPGDPQKLGILSRNAVARSVKPSAFSVRAISAPALNIELSTAVSSLRPSTLTQLATLQLIRETAQQLLASTS